MATAPKYPPQPSPVVERDGRVTRPWLLFFQSLIDTLAAAGSAPGDAEYLVGALDATLTAERLVTNTPTVTWDLSTPGQAKANATGSASGAGVPGLDGQDGLDGIPGGVGPAGAAGATGPAGPAISLGIPGSDGEDGLDAVPGLQGPQGAAGATGAPGASGAFVFLEKHTASVSASLDFPTVFSATYDVYAFFFDNVIPSTDAKQFWFRVSTDGVTYDTSGVYSYSWFGWQAGGGGFGGATGQTKSILTISTISNTSDRGITGWMYLYRPLSTTLKKQFDGIFQVVDNMGVRAKNEFLGAWETTGTALTGGQFLFDSSNTASGTIYAYGLAKS